LNSVVDVWLGTFMLPSIGARVTAVVTGAMYVGQLTVPRLLAVQAVLIASRCCATAAVRLKKIDAMMMARGIDMFGTLPNEGNRVGKTSAGSLRGCAASLSSLSADHVRSRI